MQLKEDRDTEFIAVWRTFRSARKDTCRKGKGMLKNPKNI